MLRCSLAVKGKNPANSYELMVHKELLHREIIHTKKTKDDADESNVPQEREGRKNLIHLMY